MGIEDFNNIDTKELEVAGKKYRFPLRFYDHARITGVFPADATKVQDLLPTDKFTPYQPQTNVALIYLTCFEYQRVDGLDPYNEFSISTPVVYKSTPQEEGSLGLYIWQLPVTTEEARVLGVELWGFPKFLADITFTDTGDSIVSRVRADGKEILTLTVKKVTPEVQTINYAIFTIKDGQLVKTKLSIVGEWRIETESDDATFALGNHPIAKQLSKISMGEKPVQFTYAPKEKSLLDAPGEYLLL